MDFKNKKIAVIGEGLEGKSSAKYLKEKGASVTILDQKKGKEYLSNLSKYDLIVRSPGINLELLKDVPKEKITSQTKLFFELSPAKIIGVTGTKGKGTTSSLIYEMLKKQGFDAYLGGNIGVPPFEFLDNLNVHSVVVLELSSFQLIDIEKSPNIAVMLMTTSEHLNWHKDLFEYINAKRNILRFQKELDFAVINKDYLASRESDVETNGQIYYVSRIEEVLRGCFIKDNALWIRDGDFEEKVINASDILIPGEHNYENACASVMAAYLAGVEVHNIAQVLKTFKGLEHRLELVAEINGVKYYDDSFSTTPETAIAAINAFSDPEILILGGSSKNSDFSSLGEIVKKSKNIKAIIGIGVEWEKIKNYIKNPSSEIYIIEGAKDMNTIVAAAFKIAAPNDVVLLTPACASFDMFENYKDRGNQFKKEVLALLKNESN
ncbi:MAG TPA: UDP-N-acetylmuramoyl-L-alanine--D-glutamate ligase [Candidatus Sulfotelmatobacter sp.]|nr:UDP-N-acetylmuramoyl-L-alanine--D-glutamate ligase [Candidatus Sulfotelmatobacter sp.]